MVAVTVNDGSGNVSVSVTHPNLCDGEFHAIKVSKHRRVIRLKVDSLSKKKAGADVPATHSSILRALYVGGAEQVNGAAVTSPFVGCLRNVSLNNKRVAFETGARVVGHVAVNRCPAS
ncbi:laminin subunit alpha-4-like [Entelurus aequoreus]|uniref:laminin subunit alpha-4-like n=1 Tax=Entelurus aequoreus TaxID=161455 RepID=UPI002B1CF718|nr:laminin subunit alpha-4-like [Entelurus aequoreus]